MQTFLPYRDFAKCAKVLDRQRLGKQRLEARQILSANLKGPGAGWYSHPVTVKWRGLELELTAYGMAICKEWSLRGYSDQQFDWFLDRYLELVELGKALGPLPWATDAMCSMHRAALLGKSPDWYGQFGWTEKPTAAYDWTEYQPAIGLCPRDNFPVGSSTTVQPFQACPTCGMLNIWIYGEAYE